MVVKHWSSILLILYRANIILNAEFTGRKADENKASGTDIAQERDERLLLFATLDGMLTAVESQTGRERWKIKDSPIVQVPLETTNVMVPIFLPDPRDGSLYALDNSNEPLKKLPFTIPQLVSSSPCRNSDGILYTGKKKDSWFKLDPVTGNKQQILNWGNQSATCLVNPKMVVYVGRAKYNIQIIDSKKPENKWNVTFYDYTSMTMNKEDVSSYDLVHFTSDSSGELITFDRRGNFLWNGDLNSPVIRIYLLDREGLISVPFTSMARYTITYLLTQLMTQNGHLQNVNQMKLYPTLYIGEHTHGLYVTTSLVDRNGVTLIVPENGPLLLGGPQAQDKPIIDPEYQLSGHNYRLSEDITLDDYHDFQSLPTFGKHVVFTGHYNVPQFGDHFIGPVKEIKQITAEASHSQNIFDDVKNRKEYSQYIYMHTKFMPTDAFHQNNTRNVIIVLYQNLTIWINQPENLLRLVLIACVIVLCRYSQMYLQLTYVPQECRNITEHNSSTKEPGLNENCISLSEDLSNGYVRVGKISFHPGHLLGKGCEGTFVYRGEFDNRQVAVKRLLPECFTFADTEVSLLRESDAHPNVIRYYCMEQDRMFRYIALELCQATLFDYVLGKCNTSTIRPLDILQQATLGLSHLHSLDIVHRDIKPHNVLLSIPNKRGEVRAMISDFGLCKKLQVGKISFSRRSGITGTDGWIAPEMLNGSKRTTHAVDLFSLGCLYYYVLSYGYHPFGDSLRRQANILKGDYNLSKLRGLEWQINIQKPLLSALIHSIPEHRPSCKAVLQHPMFWNCSKILLFFQDISDRVEKVAVDDPVLKALENNRQQIVRMNWKRHIHEDIISDLRKYRSYQDESVRDLLRALRNTKHHFRELSKEAQKNLSELPEVFTQYWIKRFPLLLSHTWITMQCIANEETFRNYYHESHRYCIGYKEHFFKDISSTINPDSRVSIKYGKKKNTKYSKMSSKQNYTTVKRKQDTFLYRNLILSKKVAEATEDILYKPSKKKNRKKEIDEPITWVT